MSRIGTIMMKAREDPDKVRERKNIILSQKGSNESGNVKGRRDVLQGKFQLRRKG